MSYARDAGTAVKRKSEELARLARTAGYEADTEIIAFVRTLLAYLMRADGTLGSEERLIQVEYNQDDFSWQDEDEHTRSTVSESPGFLRTVPKFIIAAKRHDDLFGTSIACSMVGCITMICSTVTGIDASVHPDEAERSAVLLSTLRSAINVDGEP